MPAGGPDAPAQSHSFLGILWEETGLDPRVIWSWAVAEGAYAPGGTGHYNYLNLRPKANGSSYSGVPLAGVSPGGFAQFRNAEDAAKETAYWINHMPNYQGIRSAASTGNPKAQLAAIAASPWDAGHYGGGKRLTDVYNSVPGQAQGTLAGFFDWVSKNWWTKQGASNPLGRIGDFWDGVKGVPGAISGAVSDTVDATVGVAKAATSAIGFLMVPEHWLRIGEIVAGFVLVGAGLVLLARSVGAPTPSMPSPFSPQPSPKPAREGTGTKVGSATAGTEYEGTLGPRRKPARSASSSQDYGEVPF